MTAEQQVAHEYGQTREDVFRYLVSVGIRPAEAQEMSQEVFLRLFMALRKGEGIRSLRGWIFRVAHNLAMQSILRQPELKPFDGAVERSLKDGRESPEEAMFQQQRIASLQQAYRTLSPQQRQCLYLRAEGLRYREIADAIGVTVSTVNEFLNRGFSKLRKAAQ
jgi:RNA polymerase sigma-70 factor, ECF subfamily